MATLETPELSNHEAYDNQICQSDPSQPTFYAYFIVGKLHDSAQLPRFQEGSDF